MLDRPGSVQPSWSRSAVQAERLLDADADADTGAALPRVLRFPMAAALSIVVSALSLLAFRTPTFDVWAWLLWGREVAHLDLDTTWGPAFKPLPVAVATLLAPLGGAAPALWLLVARVGGLLAVIIVARLAWRWSGRLGAALAALGLLMVRQYVGYLLPHGMSEPLTVAFLLWAVDRHLGGRREAAFWLGVLGGLLRPEIWPFLLVYAVLLTRADRVERGWLVRRRRRRLAGGLVLLPVAWYLPDYLGSGEPFRQGEGVPVPGGPLTQAHPGLAVVGQSGTDLPMWVLVGAAVGLVACLAPGLLGRVLRPPRDTYGAGADRELVLLAGLGLAWLLIVAGMAETGRSTGVSRYVLPAYAVAAVLAGVGWSRLTGAVVRQVGRGRGALLGAVAMIGGLAVLGNSLVSWSRQFGDEIDELRYQRGLHHALGPALTATGGSGFVSSCGQIWTSMYQVPFVAWTLHHHIRDVWSLQQPGLSEPEYVGPLLQTRDRADAPQAPVPFSFLRYRTGGSAEADGATWTILLPADCD